MAKITDPDSLNVGVEITLNTGALTFTLIEAGNLTAKDGVTANALWAKFVDLWTSDTYQPFDFPMNIYDARSGQFVFGQDPGGAYSGWAPADDVTRQMIRDGGWGEYDAAGDLNRQYVGMVALAAGFPALAQFYYQLTATGAKADFTYDDAPNEAIQVFGDAANGDFDTRAFFKLFCREESYLYDDAILDDIDEVATGAYKLQLPIAVGVDLDITDTDGNVSTIEPYISTNIKYFTGSFEREIDDPVTNREFGIVVDVGGCHSGIDGTAPGAASVLTSAEGGMTIDEFASGTLTIYEGTDKGTTFPVVSNTATTITVTGTIAVGATLSFTAFPAAPEATDLDEFYTKVQYELRQNSDINDIAGTVTGSTASLLLNFVGSSLKCGFYAPTNPNGGGTGVLVQGVASADVNNIVFYDNGETSREYPYASAGDMTYNTPLTEGSTGYYRMYFLNDDAGDNNGYDYGTADAITVNDSDGNPITGTITSGTMEFSYDFSGNVQRGTGSDGENAPIVLVAGNAGEAKPVVVYATIIQSKAILVPAVAEVDRGYID